MSPRNLALLLEWARLKNRPVTVFDLETTSNVPYVSWFGITEVGFISLFPDGRVETRSAFVDPEHRISSEVTRLTGIRESDVANQPSWAAWAALFHAMAQDHVMVGFNSHAFDCVAVRLQNARYGVADTSFAYSLDARALPEVVGTLSQAAEHFGLCAPRAHRAMDDAWLTVELVEAVAVRHGLEALEAFLGMGPAWNRISDPTQWSVYSPRAVREAEILQHYQTHGALPELEPLAAKHGIKRSTMEGDVYRLAEKDKIPLAVLERPEVQDFLSVHLPDAIAATWTLETTGRLKPLFTYLAATAPQGFDYTQLRIALARYKAQTKAA